MTEEARTVVVRPRPGASVLVGIVLAGAAFAVVASAATGTVGGEVIQGLPDAGPGTEVALPVARLLHDLFAVATVGALLLGTVLLPSASDHAARLVRAAAGWAIAWTVATAAWTVLALSEVLGVPVPDIPERGSLVEVLVSSDLALAQLSTLWMAGVVAVVARGRPSVAMTRALLLIAVAGLLPPALVGHASHGEDRTLAVVSLSLHLTGVALWVGGLVAIVVYLRGRTELLAVAVPRFSRLALVCVVAVGASGVVGATTTVRAWDDLFGTAFGRLLLVKAAMLLVLVAVGAVHRRRTVAAAAAGRPSALLRLVAGEVVLMGAVLGVAVALSAAAP